MKAPAVHTRRDFLRVSGLAGAAIGFPTIIPACVLGADAPSNKINILQIGCGRIGRSMDMPGILRQNDARLVAVCDVDSLRVMDAKAMVEEHYRKRKGPHREDRPAQRSLGRQHRCHSGARESQL